MPRKPTPTIMEASTRFLGHRQGRVKPGTFAHYKTVLFHLSDHVGTHRRLGLIKPPEVEGWFVQLIDEDKEPSTINAYRAKVKVFHKWCLEYGYTRQDWLQDVPAEKLFAKDWVQLDPDQLLTLLRAEHHPRDRVLLALAMNTALRINEICNIKIKDVDLWKQRIRVKISKQKSRRDRIEYPPITSDLEQDLGIWLEYYEKEAGDLKPDWYLAPAKNRDYILYNRLSGYQSNSGDLRPTDKIYKPAPLARRAFESADLSIPDGQAWHVLRRSVARIYFDSQMGDGSTYSHALRRTAALLNHASTETTERYLGLNADRAARDADLAGKPFLTRLSTASQLSLSSRQGPSQPSQ